MSEVHEEPRFLTEADFFDAEKEEAFHQFACLHENVVLEETVEVGGIQQYEHCEDCGKVNLTKKRWF